MTRERIDRAASGRFTPMIHDLARVLGNDPVTALVYQTLFFRSGIEADRDGWLDMSEVRMASELSCTRYAAHEALTKLEEEYELVECQEGSGNRPDRYRVRQDKLRELLPHDAAPQPQIAVDPQPQTSSPERDSDKSLSHAHAKEEKREGVNDEKKEGENNYSRRARELNLSGNDQHPPPAAVEEEVSEGTPSPAAVDVQGVDDAESPSVAEQDADTSPDNSSDDGRGWTKAETEANALLTAKSKRMLHKVPR